MGSFDDVNDFFEGMGESFLYPDGFEDAVIGYVERFGMTPLCLLDKDICIEILVCRDGMTEEEAEEYFDFNIIGAWLGDKTPCFATLL